MSDASKTGDMPAFPIAAVIAPDGGLYSKGASGLTKREAFAMAALTGIAAGTFGNEQSIRGAMSAALSNGETINEHFAVCAIAIADALIAQLEKDRQP